MSMNCITKSLLIVLVLAVSSRAATNNNTTIEKRLTNVEEAVEKIEAELELMRLQAKMVISQTQLGFANKFYASAGFGLILPRKWMASESSDTGLGAQIGIGQYFGRHNVGEVGLEWDLYPSLTFRYRFELHFENPRLTFGPVLGYKVRLVSAGPWDNYLKSPELLKNSFLMMGGLFGFPLSSAMMTMELIYLYNDQSFLIMNMGLHVFF